MMQVYKVLEVVGEGSFGRVFKARNRETHTNVALKLIRKAGRSEKELESLRSECCILQGLRHPNIISVTACFETNSEVVVVMELAAGELFATIGTGSQLSRENMLQVTCDLLSALYYLHSQRILHRDIKPQNILLGSDGRVKLCDFGFARVMNRDTYLLTSIKGTPLYMAPEIIEEKPYDHAADLWSLGCILYELVTGSPLFNTTSIVDLVKKVRTEPVRFPASDALYPECESFLNGLLQKDPRKRLTWPAILEHDFIRDKLDLHVPEGSAGRLAPPLTDALSVSQERRREEQRQDLEAKAARVGGTEGQLLLVRTVHHLEVEKQRKMNEALLVMEAARRHRVCPARQSEPDHRQRPEEARVEQGHVEADDVEDVAIRTRARRRESLITDIVPFEDAIRQFAGLVEGKEAEDERGETGVDDAAAQRRGVESHNDDGEDDDDDEEGTVCGGDDGRLAVSPSRSTRQRLPFPFDETPAAVQRAEWERFVRGAVAELAAEPLRWRVDVATVTSLLVPLRSARVDSVVILGIARVLCAILHRRLSTFEENNVNVTKKLLEAGTVGNLLSGISRICRAAGGAPSSEDVAAVVVLFELLSTLLFADDEEVELHTESSSTLSSVSQLLLVWRHLCGSALDVFDCWGQCCKWDSFPERGLSSMLSILGQLWMMGTCDDPHYQLQLRLDISRVFDSTKENLFAMVNSLVANEAEIEAASLRRDKGSGEALIHAVCLLMMMLRDGDEGIYDNPEIEEKLRTLAVLRGTDAASGMLRRASKTILGILARKQTVE